MKRTSVFEGERLLEIEDESGLFDYQVNGVYLWQYVRYICLVRILEEITGVETISRESSITQERGKALKPGEWLKRQQFLAHKKDMLILNNERRVKEGNYYKCLVTDRILKNLDYSYYVYEDEYCGLHYKPVCTKSLKYIDINVVKKIFKYEKGQDKRQISDFAKKVISVFEEKCSVVMSKELKKYIFSYIFNMHENIYYYRIWAKIILKLVRPKLVMVTVGYKPLVQVIVAEAKKSHIPTVELQHGRIGNTHLAYNYIYKGKIESCADYMFVYGHYDKVTPRFPLDDNYVIAVGYPELEKKADYYAKHKKNNKRKVMIFISAPGAGSGEIILKYALELRKNHKLKNYRMIFKLHPCEYNDWREWYPELENSGLEVVSNDLHDIYYYLGHADYVVGISSTVLFEAIEFNCQIFVIKDGDYRKVEYLYQNHYASLIESADQIIDEMENHPVSSQETKENEYFKVNSIQNVQDQIKRILSGQEI